MNLDIIPSMSSPVYRRVLLKLSGEALMGEQQYGIDPAVATRIARDIGEIQQLGVQTAVVIGGGNLFRGLAASAKGMDRAPPTTWACSPRSSTPSRCRTRSSTLGSMTRVPTAIEMRAVAEPFIRRRAIRHLEKGRVVIFAAGTGNPYFTTDTAAALRAMEMGGGHPQGHQGRRHLHGRSDDRQDGDEVLRDLLPEGARTGPEGHGRDGDLVVHGQPPADHRVQPAHSGNLKRVIMGEPIGTTVTVSASALTSRQTHPLPLLEKV